MDTLIARPNVLKQANLSKIREVLKAKGTATRAEIAEETMISFTTVRSLLTEMMERGEIRSVGYDESSGGRKAERYGLTPDRYYGAAFCLTEQQIHCLLIDVFGGIVEKERLDVSNGDFEGALFPFLDVLTSRRRIKSIGLGVPGIVDGGAFWRQDKSGALNKMDLGGSLAERYNIPVILENDLNATAIGFCRCYEKEFPQEKQPKTNMAYLHFEEGCVSAGLIAGGRVIRGCNNFAGELGLVPVEGDKLLDECMAEPMDNNAYIRRVITIISWVCGILNPQYVVLGGPSLRRECIAPVSDGLSALLPDHMIAEILYAPDVWHDYYDGMAYLTAGKMFDEVQFIKE